MSRPIWKGFITVGLINIPVILYSAEKKFDIQFKLVDIRDKSRIRYLRINEQTGEEVPWEDVAKGYEYDKHNYVVFKEEELKKIAGENSKTIHIENFVNKDELDYIYFEKPYFLVPDKRGEKGYVILREALKKTNKVAITKVVIHTREYLAVLMPHENALMLDLLRYHQELKKASEFELPSSSVKPYKISPKEMVMAKQLIDAMSAHWNPKAYHDEFRHTLEKWVDQRIRHKKPAAAEKEAPSLRASNVINFADLFKKSLKEQQAHRKKKALRKHA